MSAIQNVALAGATGNLGPPVLNALVKAGFNVTILTRQNSDKTYPSGVKVARVDYDSFDSLVTALKGQDAVVSTVGSPAVDAQKLLIDAAIAANVKRIIPSEYGSDTLNPKSRSLPAYAAKVATHEYLVEKTRENLGFTYTLVINGGFLDWGLKMGFFVNAGAHKADLFDGGDRPFSATTLAGIGKAVAGVLKHPEETKNRAVYVHETVTTQRQLMEIVDKFKPGPWETTEVDSAKREREVRETLKQPNPNPYIVFDLYKVALWRAGYGGEYKKVDNDLLGVELLSEKQLEDLVRSVL